jgi:arsenite methyltransferase
MTAPVQAPAPAPAQAPDPVPSLVTSNLRKPDWGLDAPGFQLFARYGGVLAVVVGRMINEHGVVSSVPWMASVGSALMWMGTSFFVVSAVSYFGSKIGKLLLRDGILESIDWRGDEQVLDVGCGHGLLLIGAAKKLKSGHAVGVDVWSHRDQKNNSAQATKENACIEGVANRIEIQDADARKLPFADGSFDVVLSSFAIHNISGSSERETAIREIARVLKPGGRLAIADIRHSRAYQKVLQGLGWEDTHLSRRNFLVFVTPTRVLRATKPGVHA